MPHEPTTLKPVEATRSVVEAVNRRDFDAVESLYAEDAVLVGNEIGEFDGAAAIRGLYEDMAMPYGNLRSEIDQVIDLGSGVIFGIVTVVGHPIGSTSEVRFRYAATAVVADGVIGRQTNSLDIDEARAAAERLADKPG
jgi:ketosteroid isomerase-like protein